MPASFLSFLQPSFTLAGRMFVIADEPLHHAPRHGAARLKDFNPLRFVRHSAIEHAGFVRHTDPMGKTKIPATGEGYLGEIMVHRISHAVGVVEHVTEARAGWPPQITLKLADGTLKKGRLSDFRDASAKERATIAPA